MPAQSIAGACARTTDPSDSLTSATYGVLMDDDGRRTSTPVEVRMHVRVCALGDEVNHAAARRRAVSVDVKRAAAVVAAGGRQLVVVVVVVVELCQDAQ